jgi:anti-sigma factor RsiW
MKTFEERYTAWVDGQLEGDALTAFEKELAAHPEAVADRAAARKLGDLLRKYAAAPALSNVDFFSLQLERRIEAEKPVLPLPPEPVRAAGFSIFARFAWAGAFFLLLAGLSFFLLVPHGAPPPSNYFAQVVESWPSDPSISATTVYNPQDNVTVLWLDGLDYMPGDQLALK